MAFNNQVVKSWFTGTATPFTAPLASYNGSKIALATITSGSSASSAGLVLNVGGVQNVEWDSLSALIETNLTTLNITATPKWQMSADGSNWIDVVGKNAAANVTKAAAGTGSLVTTQWVQLLDGWNPGFPYVRLAVQVGAATGAAGDNVTVSYFFRKRSIAFG